MADEGPAPIVAQSAEEPPAPAEEAPPPPPPPPETQVEPESDGAQMKVQQKKSCFKSFCEFLYDGKTGKVLGRGGMSWFKILVFYIIFYVAIFAFFFMLLFIVFQFTRDTQPRLIGENSLLKGSPGLGFRPSNPYKGVNPNTALIWYEWNKPDEWKKYTDQLKTIVEQEKEEKDESIKKSYVNCSVAAMPKNGEICRAYMDPKDKIGLNWGDCTVEKNFGYDKGKPCVLIRLNRIIGWNPKITGQYRESKAYIDLKNEMNFNVDEFKKEDMEKLDDFNKYIWIRCYGDRPVDKALVGTMSFYPHHHDPNTKGQRPPMSIPYTFFPYMRQKGYLDPFIFVQFRSLTPGVLIQIRCQAYNANIKIDSKDGLGSVRFEILVDSSLPTS